MDQEDKDKETKKDDLEELKKKLMEDSSILDSLGEGCAC